MVLCRCDESPHVVASSRQWSCTFEHFLYNGSLKKAAEGGWPTSTQQALKQPAGHHLSPGSVSVSLDKAWDWLCEEMDHLTLIVSAAVKHLFYMQLLHHREAPVQSLCFKKLLSMKCETNWVPLYRHHSMQWFAMLSQKQKMHSTQALEK